MTGRHALVPILLLIGICPGLARAHAQEISSDPPAHIALVDGSAVLEREGRIDTAPAAMPLLTGDRLRTQGGRVEVLFADGSALHLDANTVLDFQSDEIVRLLDGRIRLSIAGSQRVAYRIDAAAAWVQIGEPGEYRVTIVRDDEVELAVLRGSAELVNEHGRSYIRAGERTFARAGAAPSPAYVFNSAAWDAFDEWSEARRDARLGTSARYLPDDVRAYASAFDRYGSWRHEPTYGYVWYPRVATGWRPYHYGRWASLRPYGWTWIAHDPWGWPTHHYGRWGISAGAWFWIPGRHWAPAWVSWAYAPSYVSWCPLGWNDRPVLQIVNVNVFGGRHYSPWDAWTVLPRRHFDGGPYVNVAAVGSVRLPPAARGAFVVRDDGPEVRYAVGRAAEPIRTAGRYAVPRGGAPGARAVPRDGSAPLGAVAAPATRGAAGVDSGRGFPSPSRQPRAASGEAVTPPAAGSSGRARAVTRGSSGGSPESATRGIGQGASASPLPARPSRRAREIGPGSEVPASGAAITPAPSGAVRAVPRTREADSWPGAQAPARSAPSRRAPGPAYEPRDEYRTAPVPGPSEGNPSAGVPSRRAPSAIAPPSPAPERRAVPRSGGTPAAPAYRSAPSREAEPAPPVYRSAPSRGAPPAPPAYRSAPSGEAPPEAPVYRSAPSRETPPEAPAYRSGPSREAPPAPPAYRSAPSREAPSAPAPPAYRPGPSRQAPSAPAPSGGAGPAAPSAGPSSAEPSRGSRSRPADTPSEGQARRRR